MPCVPIGLAIENNFVATICSELHDIALELHSRWAEQAKKNEYTKRKQAIRRSLATQLGLGVWHLEKIARQETAMWEGFLSPLSFS